MSGVPTWSSATRPTSDPPSRPRCSVSRSPPSWCWRRGCLLRPDLVSPPLQVVRAEHGLAADPDLAMLTRGLVLAPFPPSFRSPSSPLPLPATTFSFRPGDRVPATRRAGRPRVYVTLGTSFNTGSGDLFERCWPASQASTPTCWSRSGSTSTRPTSACSPTTCASSDSFLRSRCCADRPGHLARRFGEPDGRPRPRPAVGAAPARCRPAAQRAAGRRSSASPAHWTPPPRHQRRSVAP